MSFMTGKYVMIHEEISNTNKFLTENYDYT
jgi:hypothetical protein